MENFCLNCKKPIPEGRLFCNTSCAAKYRSAHIPKKALDVFLDIVLKATGGKLPHGVLTEVGDLFGVSRERIRQKLAKLKVVPVNEQSRVKIRVPKNCTYCGKKFIPRSKSSKYCSTKCLDLFRIYNYYRLAICENCGLGFLVYRSRTRGKVHIYDDISTSSGSGRFCSRSCFGSQMSKRPGFVGSKYRISSKEQLITSFGDGFTLSEFREKYKFSKNYVYPVLDRLIKEGWITEEDFFGKYKIIK